MPTYQYRCNDCGFEFEEFQSMSDEPIDKCPKCAGHPRRLISGGAGFLFKGSGFYITDHRSDKYKKAAEMDKPSMASSTKSSDSSKKESKSKKNNVKKSA